MGLEAHGKLVGNQLSKEIVKTVVPKIFCFSSLLKTVDLHMVNAKEGVEDNSEEAKTKLMEIQHKKRP